MAVNSESSVVDLQQAMREVRIAQAERDDVIVELQETEKIRLTLLEEALEKARDEVPEGADEFALAVLPGSPPRLWIDATSFVMMGRDKRTYRFLKDTRLGRTVLAEESDIDAMANSVVRYVAERIVLRERALEGDYLAAERSAPEPSEAAPVRPRGSRGTFWALAGFVLGMICGAFLLLVYAWVNTPG